MQKDLDAYLQNYNEKRPHQGRNMNGQVPYTVFKKELPKVEKPTTKKGSEKAA